MGEVAFRLDPEGMIGHGVGDSMSWRRGRGHCGVILRRLGGCFVWGAEGWGLFALRLRAWALDSGEDFWLHHLLNMWLCFKQVPLTFSASISSSVKWVGTVSTPSGYGETELIPVHLSEQGLVCSQCQLNESY